MRGLKLMLFGIAVILSVGFLVVAEAAAGYPYRGGLVWGLVLGLGLSFVGLLLGNGGERAPDTGSDGRDDQRGDDSNDDERDADDGDDAETDDGEHYSESFFPPM